MRIKFNCRNAHGVKLELQKENALIRFSVGQSQDGVLFDEIDAYLEIQDLQELIDVLNMLKKQLKK